MPTISRYRRQAPAWNPEKFGGNTSIPTGRDALVAGVHKPNTRANVGPYTVTNWTDQNPVSGYAITISTPGTGGPLGDAYYGIRYWGQLRVTVPGVKFRECEFMGPDPLLAPDTDQSAFRCFGGSHNGNDQKTFYVYDSLFDPEKWVTVRGRTAAAPVSMGFHGYNFQCYRSEFINVQDPIEFIGCNGLAGGTTVADQDSLSQQNWYHKGKYVNNYYGAADGQVHSDAIQTMYGKNLTSRGDYIGGQRSMTGYWTWPTGGEAPFLGPGYNSGDDFYGAGFQLNQEVSNDATRLIENVLIEDGWIEGCGQGINLGTTAHANDWSTLTVQNMKFIARTGPDSALWGRNYRGDGPGTPSRLWNSNAGMYIIRNPARLATFTNNTIEGTGAAVPISNGA